MTGKKRVIAVVGPTASGKTALAVELARLLGGEVISCDSMQVYKGMDIGTAKVTADEMRGVKHHLIDVALPSDEFSCADYSELARKSIDDITERGLVPVFCGGTGLYLDGVIGISSFSDAGRDDAFRAEMEKKSAHELHLELSRIDPVSASATHENNVKRVIRALEIYHLTGKTKSEWDELSRQMQAPYDSVIIGLDYKDRATLYDRINRRVDIMLENGLVNEVRELDCEAFRASNASDGIGYKELLRYFDGELTLDEAVEEIKKASRNYAKRQLTWFRRNKSVKWIFVDELEGEEKFKLIVNSALNIINNN